MNRDEDYMARALLLAERAMGKTEPNPMVGAVIVKNGRVIAEGYHRKAGTPHAEAVALRKAGARARGATLYVNLEPCCHTEKKTPPCTDAIIRAGITRVVGAMPDPNPRVRGRGFRLLKKAGIRVDSGLLGKEARSLNRVFTHFIKTGRPFVTLKAAVSLDGKIAAVGGESKWITGASSRRMVHRLRSRHQAIMVGVGTVLADDPSLTARVAAGRNPVRIIVDGKLEIPPESRLLHDGAAPVLIATTVGEGHRTSRELESEGVQLIHMKGTSGKLDMKELMQELARRDISSLLLEGGSGINAAALNAGVVNRVVFFVAPKIIGGRDAISSVGGMGLPLSEAHRLGHMSVRRAGSDLVIEADVLR